MSVGRVKRIASLFLMAICVNPRLMADAASGKTETPAIKVLTLDEAIKRALANYPAIRAAQERIAAAQAGVSLSRTSYLPRLDSLWQSNRATANNIFGLVLPQSTIPSISGPVLPAATDRNVWGSAAGLLFSWQAYDFGYRRARVETARTTEERTAEESAVTRLEVEAPVSEAFFSLLAAEQTAHSAQADVDRRQTLANNVRVLVDNQLRPGADASRADAELAAARTELIRAEQQQEVSRAALAQSIGMAGTQVDILPGPFLASAPGNLPSAAPPISQHPLALAEQARVNETLAREREVDRTDYPAIYFQSSVYGRGSGAALNGTFAGGLNGLGLERGNWAIAATVMFPDLFDFVAKRAQKQIATANERAEAAHYDETIQQLTGQLEQGLAALEGARRIAQNTPIELRAARETEVQARARYQAGLTTMVEVADAESLLVRAETDDALARLAVWHNLAMLAAAEGNLDPFLEAVRQQSAGGH